MMAARILCVFGCLASHHPAAADAPWDTTTDRIAAHFESLSSRLVPEDTELLTQFVTRAATIPGAKLVVLVPAANEPLRARFVAARLAELERHVRPLANGAEFRKVPGNVAADVVWLVVITPTAAIPPENAVPAALLPAPAVKMEALSQPTGLHPAAPVNPADLQLSNWVVRGVKRPTQGPIYAYVARTGSAEAPREIVEQQTDKEFGLVRDIGKLPNGAWIVHTEIGWIGQASAAGSPEAGEE